MSDMEEAVAALAIADSEKSDFLKGCKNALQGLAYEFVEEGHQRGFARGYTAAQSQIKWCFDMDKAPRDRTQIFLKICGLSEGIVVARWCDRVGAWDTSAGMAEAHESEWLNVAHELTCWMLPPPSPKEQI